MMKTAMPVFALLLAALAPALAKTFEGVDVPASVIVSGKKLALNGAGVRVVKFSFIPIKAYVAAFYAPTPVKSAGAVEASPGPLKFTFTFLQGVGQGQVTDAWNAQFKASVSAPYPGLAKDQAKFVAMFGPLRKGGIEAVEIDGNATRVYDGGELKGAIDGKDFQRAFLSMWFGSRPVMESLKADLLGS